MLIVPGKLEKKREKFVDDELGLWIDLDPHDDGG